MALQQRKLCQVFLVTAYVFTLSLLTYNITQASSLELDVRSSGIDIQAEEVSLIDILKVISDKTGIILKSGDDLTDPVTVNLKAVSVENCIHRLLAGRNYALIYKKTQDDRSVPIELRVVGSGALKNMTLNSLHISDIDTEPPASDDHMKKYQRKWFKQAFADTKNLPKQISTEFISDGHNQSGIRITRLAENSVFRKIGLNQGDIINDVNSEPVTTGPEFIEALRSAFNGNHLIRIERLKKDRLIDPIYIELN